MIVGTSLEPLARKVHAAFTRKWDAADIFTLEEVEKINPNLVLCDPDGEGLHGALSSERDAGWETPSAPGFNEHVFGRIC